MATLPLTFKSLTQTTKEILSLIYAKSGIKPDDTQGSVIRTLAEAIGFQVEDLTYRFDSTLEKGIPLAIFKAFNFQVLGAQKATSTVRFTRPTANIQVLVIPANTIVTRADGVEYITTTEGTIGTGNTFVDILVEAIEAGIIGNTPVNTIRVLSVNIPEITEITNILPASGGQDEESIPDAQARFADYVDTLHRSTRESIRAAVLQYANLPTGEKVKEAVVYDAVYNDDIPWGRFTVLIDDGTGATPANLLLKTQEVVDEHRPAGSLGLVVAAVGRPVNVKFTLDGNEEDLDACKTAAIDYFAALKVQDKVSRENLITVISNAARTPREIDLIVPATDVEVTLEERVTLGSLTGTML